MHKPHGVCGRLRLRPYQRLILAHQTGFDLWLQRFTGSNVFNGVFLIARDHVDHRVEDFGEPKVGDALDGTGPIGDDLPPLDHHGA